MLFRHRISALLIALLVAVPTFAGPLVELPRQLVVDISGKPRSGAKLFVYAPGTTTPRVAYTSAAYSTPHTSPIVATADGFFPAVYVKPTDGDYKLVLKSSADVLLWSEDNIPALGFTAADLGRMLQPRIQTEINLSLVPVNYAYTVTPEVDPRRYGAVCNGIADDTIPLQLSINVAAALNGTVHVPDNCTLSSGAISLTMPGNRLTQGLTIRGAGVNSSVITQRGTPTSVFTFAGPTPTGNPQEINLVIRDLTIIDKPQSHSAHGITLNGVGSFRFSNVIISGFDRGIYGNSALIGLVDQNSQISDNNTGLYLRRNSTGSTANLVAVRDSRITLNASWGVDFNGGSGLLLTNNDIEANGTATDVNTGGVLIRGALAPDSLVANVMMENNWFESNKGTMVFVEAPTGGVSTNITIRGGMMVGAEDGRAIRIYGAGRVLIEDLQSLTPGDTWNVVSSFLSLRNTIVSVLTDTGVTWKDYQNATTAAYTRGGMSRDGFFTGTLTGVSGTVTGSIFYSINGSVVTLTIPTLTGTSTTTAATITGMPVELRPVSVQNGVAQIRNSNADAMGVVSVGSDGVITLNRGDNSAFTNSSGKGVLGATITYRLYN